MKLSWNQVLGWRLSRHALSPRASRRSLGKIVSRLGGVQAQVMSAAEMALWARIDGITAADVRRALWRERRLVKTWAMRGTLHLVSAAELPLYVAARARHDGRSWPGYLDSLDIDSETQEAFLAAVPAVLGDEPMTREQLSEALAGHLDSPKLGRMVLAANWGTPLKPSAFRGDLCFGPSRGQTVTFVDPRKWIGEWRSVDPDLALREVVRRYLRSYGPATPKEFVRWWWGGSGLLAAKRLFAEMEDEIQEVEVEGLRGYVLRSTLGSMRRAEPPRSVNLLPLFDAYTFGFAREVDAILSSAHRPRVFRPQGWVSAVVLDAGSICGVWQHRLKGARLELRLRMFDAPGRAARRAVEAEAGRLAAFAGSDSVEVAFEEL